MTTNSPPNEQILPPLEPKKPTELDDLYDDALLAIFRCLGLYDLVRTESVNHRWRYLQGKVLREKRRLLLLDDYACTMNLFANFYTKMACEDLARAPPLSHDVLPISNMLHLVSFLYFLAPRMPNIEVLMVNINWAAPEQLAQILLKFNNVKCLTLIGKPTDLSNSLEWAPLHDVLASKYTRLLHFSTNFHLAPEMTYDPVLVRARLKLLKAIKFVDVKILLPKIVLRGINLVSSVYLKVERQLFFLATRMTTANGVLQEIFQEDEEEFEEVDDEENDFESDDEDDDVDIENGNVAREIAEPVSLARRPLNWLVKWFICFFHFLTRFFVLGPFSFSLPRLIWPFFKVNTLYFPFWTYLYQVEELNIPNHKNTFNRKTYSFDSNINTNKKLRKLTIGDTKLLNAMRENLFVQLSSLTITDVWVRLFFNFSNIFLNYFHLGFQICISLQSSANVH